MLGFKLIHVNQRSPSLYCAILQLSLSINTLRRRQNGCHFTDDNFKCICLNENIWIQIEISLKFVPKGPINKIPALVQIMAWRHPRDKTLSEPMMISLPMHICITRLQWVNTSVFVTNTTSIFVAVSSDTSLSRTPGRARQAPGVWDRFIPA